MTFQKKAVVNEESMQSESTTTVKMKFVGHFRGLEKRVMLPVPLVSNSQKLDKELIFARTSNRNGPAFCDVPLEWVGALLDVGGNWQMNEKLTPELQVQIDAAHAACDAKMADFAKNNELVEA